MNAMKTNRQIRPLAAVETAIESSALENGFCGIAD
jgi:hypothetical protein